MVSGFLGASEFATFRGSAICALRVSPQADALPSQSESDDPLIRRLFPAPEPKKGRQVIHTCSRRFMSLLARSQIPCHLQPTLGGQFKTSLQELYEKLMSTAPSFIKCIKSNQVKQPGLYDATFTLKQIRYLGLLEVIAIRKQGFPIRRTPKEMFARYQLLDAKARTARDIMTNLKIDSELWQMGKSLFFMKDECFTDMESRRAAKVEESALALQSFFKVCHPPPPSLFREKKHETAAADGPVRVSLGRARPEVVGDGVGRRGARAGPGPGGARPGAGADTGDGPTAYGFCCCSCVPSVARPASCRTRCRFPCCCADQWPCRRSSTRQSIFSSTRSRQRTSTNSRCAPTLLPLAHTPLQTYIPR